MGVGFGGFYGAWASFNAGHGSLPSAAGSLGPGLQEVGGAAHTLAASIEDVGVDHGGFEVAMAQQLLDGADVVTA